MEIIIQKNVTLRNSKNVNSKEDQICHKCCFKNVNLATCCYSKSFFRYVTFLAHNIKIVCINDPGV